MSKPRILFTGFEPFDGADYNPSWPVAEAAATASGSSGRLVPVTYAAVRELATSQPASMAVVAVGLSRKSSGVAIETLARRDGGMEPDNSGVIHAASGPLTGPRFLRVGVLARQLANALRPRTDLLVSESDDAGGYVCNSLLYHLLEARGTGGPLGVFVHVPALTPTEAHALGVALGHAMHEVFASGPAPETI